MFTADALMEKSIAAEVEWERIIDVAIERILLSPEEVFDQYVSPHCTVAEIAQMNVRVIAAQLGELGCFMPMQSASDLIGYALAEVAALEK